MDWDNVASLTDRIIIEGRSSVRYEPLTVQARTIAAVLYPDRNLAASGERWRTPGGGF